MQLLLVLSSYSSGRENSNFADVCICAAIGLQKGFRSLQWLSTIPPILIVIGFKTYINQTFDKAFRFYYPSDDELRAARVHSERADHKGNRLERRFGHPALHADLFTPMLHAKMMPLLGQVYRGQLGRDETKLNEYGGQKVDAHVVEGIKIAAIDQRDLEYDPALYQRDRGELDSDARSMASFDMLGDGGSTLTGAKSMYYANTSTSKLAGYDRYLTQGPQGASASTHDIEMTRLETDNEPLLPAGAVATPPAMYRDASGFREAPTHRPYGSSSALGQAPSYTSLPGPDGEYEVFNHSPIVQHQQPNMNMGMGRNSPRPGTPQRHQQQPSYGQQAAYGQQTYPPQQQGAYPPQHQQRGSYSQHQQHASQGSMTNMAGRGTYRG
ncbi:hypothetical protein HGRIS_002055 [Hohenbuehelia grisea]|uniref:Uncharacterized protein n=1 Tax=Hohenbuehelia grisea TaxID=104357 RepID=A0ABR3JKM5_9AGAR